MTQKVAPPVKKVQATSAKIPPKDSLPLDEHTAALVPAQKNIPSSLAKPKAQKPQKSTAKIGASKTHTQKTHSKKVTYPDMLDIKYITGRFNQRKHPDFVRLDDRYCAYPDMYLRKEVYQAFLEMRAAAQKDGIKLVIRSATRNFFTQKRIWENKWTGKRNLSSGENLAKTKSHVTRAKKILLYSAMPGSSRHHWGTDIDLNDLANSYFEKGRGYKMYQWMLKNAHDHGFYLVYTEKGPKRKTGYNEERWHWTYLPTSKKILAQAKKVLKDEDFKGFLGAETAPKIHIVRDFVLGINPECL